MTGGAALGGALPFKNMCCSQALTLRGNKLANILFISVCKAAEEECQIIIDIYSNCWSKSNSGGQGNVNTNNYNNVILLFILTTEFMIPRNVYYSFTN